MPKGGRGRGGYGFRFHPHAMGTPVAAAPEEPPEEPGIPASSTAGAFGVWEERLQMNGLHRAFTMYETDILSPAPLTSEPNYLRNFGVTDSAHIGTLIHRDATEEAIRFDLIQGEDVANWFANFSEDASVLVRAPDGQIFIMMEIKWDDAMHDTYFHARSVSHSPVRFTVSIASPAVLTIDVAPTNNEDYLTEGMAIWICGGTVLLSDFSEVASGTLPTGLVKGGQVYYVRNPTGGGDSIGDTCNLSLTPSGALIDTSGSQSGSHYYVHQERQGGIKFFDIVGGDYPGGPGAAVGQDPYNNWTHWFSSATTKTVIQTHLQHRFPLMYARGPSQGDDIMEDRPGGNHDRQNDFEGGGVCLAETLPTHGVGPTIPGPGGCWEFPKNRWVPMMLSVTFLGARFQNPPLNLWSADARRELFINTEDGGPWVRIINFGPESDSYYPQCVNDWFDPGGAFGANADLDVGLGKTFVFPYLTNKAIEQEHTTAKVWVRRLIVAGERIAAPMTLAPNAPAAGNWREISGGNTMRTVFGSDVNVGQHLASMLDVWNSSTYVRDAGPYGLYHQWGGGHCLNIDQALGQHLAGVDADCLWKSLNPLTVTTYPSTGLYTLNDGGGAYPDGDLADASGYTEPAPAHTYDAPVAIPASAFGNENGAVCIAVLNAVGCGSGGSEVDISLASPGVFTVVNGPTPAEGDSFWLGVTGTLPTGLDTGVEYFARNISGATFNASATALGALINTSGTNTGTYIANRLFFEGPNVPTTRSYAWFQDMDLALDADVEVRKTSWSRSSNEVPSNASVGNGNSAVYDSTRQCVWLYGGSAPTHLAKLQNLSTTRDWTSVAHGNPALNASGDLTGGYCPTLDCVVWYFFNAVDPANPRLFVWKPNEAGDDGDLYIIEVADMVGTPPTNVCGLEWVPHASIQEFYGMAYKVIRNVTIDTTTDVITAVGHGLPANQKIWMDNAGGASPSPIGGSTYYVLNPTTDTLQISLTPGGAALDMSGPQSGEQYIRAAYPNPRMVRLIPPASLPGTWEWAYEDFIAEGGATLVANDSINPRYNAARWAWPFMSLVWGNSIEGKTNLFRPLRATSIDE
jgi:hypothetical protein